MSETIMPSVVDFAELVAIKMREEARKDNVKPADRDEVDLLATAIEDLAKYTRRLEKRENVLREALRRISEDLSRGDGCESIAQQALTEAHAI